MIYFLLFCNLFISLIALKLFYKYLRFKNIIDIPNERSMHDTPKIRGGGATVLIIFSLSIIILFSLNYISLKITLGILSGSIILGVVGWVDDKKGLNPILRFLFQIIVSILLLYFLDYSSYVFIMGERYYIHNILFFLFLIFYIIWMINLYNFMDGIDGLATIQVIIPNLFITIFAYINNHNELMYISLFMISSIILFLKYNWPPSKMFMGDVLSGFLGFFYSFLTFCFINLSYSVFFIPILMAIFIFDTTYTLIKRLLNRDKFWEAHNNHFYQQFAKIYGHKKVTIACIIINFILFIPAYLCYQYQQIDLLIFILTYLIFGILIISLKKFYLIEKSIKI